MTYKRFRELEKERDAFIKEHKEREKARLDDLKEKVSFKIGELPDPQPVAYPTFDKYIKQYSMGEKKKSKKKSKLISDGIRGG